MKTQTSLLMGVIGFITLLGSPSLAQNNLVDKLELSPLRVRLNHQLSPNAIAETPTILEQTSSSNQFQTFTTAIEKAGLEATMTGVGPYTIFAPTDEAFAELPQSTLEELLQPENKEILVQLLGYHITWGKLTLTQLKPGEIRTIGGASILVRLSQDGTVTINNSKVTQANIPASNGIIHAVDKLILPPNLLR